MGFLKMGIDVSTHQGIIDWEKVKESKVDFAMIRGGFGQNFIDDQFERNMRECNRLGIPAGVYWFSYALTIQQAVKEAEYCLQLIKDYRIEYPVAYDLEYHSVKYAHEQGVVIDKIKASNMVKAFCGEIERQGYYALNYSNKDYLLNMFDEDLLEKYDLWYAFWNDELDRECGIWQYSSTGLIGGINGNVDLNFAYKDYPKIFKENNLNRLNEKPVINYSEKYFNLLTELKKLIGVNENGFKL